MFYIIKNRITENLYFNFEIIYWTKRFSEKVYRRFSLRDKSIASIKRWIWKFWLNVICLYRIYCMYCVYICYVLCICVWYCHIVIIFVILSHFYYILFLYIIYIHNIHFLHSFMHLISFQCFKFLLVSRPSCYYSLTFKLFNVATILFFFISFFASSPFSFLNLLLFYNFSP